MKYNNQITDSTVNVYTNQSNKDFLVYIDINPISTNPSYNIFVNNLLYHSSNSLNNLVSYKMILSPNDNIKVGVNGTINVFIYGVEL